MQKTQHPLLMTLQSSFYDLNFSNLIGACNQTESVYQVNHHLACMLTTEYSPAESLRFVKANYHFPVINLFDYLQGFSYLQTTDYRKHTPLRANQIGLSAEIVLQPSSIAQDGGMSYDGVVDNDIRVKMILDGEQVKQVNFYDVYHNVVETDIYDIRGFLSSSIYYADHNIPLHQVWFNKQGAVVLTHRLLSNDQRYILHEQGKELYFDNLWLLQRHALTQIIQHFLNQQDIVMNTTESPLIDLCADLTVATTSHHYYCLATLPNMRYGNGDDPMANLKAQLSQWQNASQVAGLVVPTTAEKKDIQKMTKLNKPIFNWNIGVAFPQKTVPLQKRQNGSLICLQNLSDDCTSSQRFRNHVLELLEAVCQVHQQYPKITLYLYGFRGSPETANITSYRKALANFIEINQMSEYVLFDNYLDVQYLDQKFNECQAYINMSETDNQSLGGIYALAHGNVMIAHQGKYDFAQLVQTNRNGWLLSDFSHDLLKDTLIKLMNLSTQRWQRFSQASYRLAQNYSPAKNTKQFDKIYQSLKHKN